MRTRFERAVQRGAARCFARFVERMHFGMRLAGALVRPLADDDAVRRHDAGADDRVRRRPSEPAPRVLERTAHPSRIRVGPRGGSIVTRRVIQCHHFSWNNAST
jgi:hypothetical protein